LIFGKFLKSKKEIWLSQCLDQNEKALVRYVYSLLKDIEAARDIVQDSFLKLWQQDQKELSGRETEWLFTVCRNRAYDYLRRKERKHISDSELNTEVADSSLSAEDLIAAQTEQGALESLIQGLNEQQKEVLHLKFEQGLSYKEISQITGMSVNHVGVFIHNTVKALKEKAQQKGRHENS
jgi:RNA polymerase sigma factor (sigma-70 family)